MFVDAVVYVPMCASLFPGKQFGPMFDLLFYFTLFNVCIFVCVYAMDVCIYV